MGQIVRLKLMACVCRVPHKDIQYSDALMSLMPPHTEHPRCLPLSGSHDAEEMEMRAIRIQHMSSL